MNTAADILSYAKNHDIHLRAEGGQIKINAPENELTDDFLDSAKEHKQEIIKVLSKQHSESQSRIYDACRGLDLTPAEFAAICSKEDIRLIGEGEFSPKDLRAYAESIDEGIKSGRIVFHPMTDALIKPEVEPNQPGGAA